MKIAFLLDPLEHWDTDDDTSFALMLECRRRGHRVCAFESRSLLLRGSVPGTLLHELELEPGGRFRVIRSRFGGLDRFQALVIRKEPPFDADYLGCTYLLEPLRKKIFIMNDPAGIRDVNEKIAALYLRGLGPRSAALYSERELVRAERWIGGRSIVLKRSDEKGGTGVFKTSWRDPLLRARFHAVTDGGRAPAVIQRFIPHRIGGDKRILILGGRAIGAFTRIPGPNDFRANMSRGGRAAPAALSARDLKIVAALRPMLRAKGLHFVGIDVLAGRLSEINVTSPAGIPEINAFEGTRLEERVVTYIERSA